MTRTTVSFVSLLLFLAPAAAQAADPIVPGPWKYGAVVGLNLSQSSFSDNWAGGDRGTINWVSNADLEAQRQFSRTFHLANTLKLAYGQTSQQDAGRNWGRPDKTTDQIQFDSMGRFTLGKWVDPYLALRAESQFVDQSDPVGDLLLNPVKVSESGGVARVFLKGEDREVVSRLGFAFRQSIARSFTDDTGDATESFVTNDGGLEFKTEAKHPLAGGRILYKGELLVFLPVFFSKSDALDEFDAAAKQFAASQGLTRESVADFWKDPDINFQNEFSSEVTSWLDVSLFVQFVYDKFDAATKINAFDPADAAAARAAIARVDRGVRKAGQFKQTLALGLSYRFL